MPMHDWTRVEAGVYHDFHGSWITHLKEALNNGALPKPYYAMSEQHYGKKVADVLTLTSREPLPRVPANGGVAVMPPPKVARKITLRPPASQRHARRTISIRHATTHTIVALLEVFSPSNKDRFKSVEAVCDKALAALELGIHLLHIDPFPPGLHDPIGLAAAVCQEFFDPDQLSDFPLPGKPLTLASYDAESLPDVYLESIAPGDVVPDMPLYLEPDMYIQAPLEATYQRAFRGVPEVWREELEQG